MPSLSCSLSAAVWLLLLVLSAVATSSGCEWPTPNGDYFNTKYIDQALGYFSNNYTFAPSGGVAMTMPVACGAVGYYGLTSFGTRSIVSAVNMSADGAAVQSAGIQVMGMAQPPHLHPDHNLVSTVVAGPTPCLLAVIDASSLEGRASCTIPHPLLARSSGSDFIVLAFNVTAPNATMSGLVKLLFFSLSQLRLTAEVEMPPQVADVTSMIALGSGADTRVAWLASDKVGNVILGCTGAFGEISWILNLNATRGAPTTLVYAAHQALLLVTFPSSEMIAIEAANGTQRFTFACHTLNAPISPAVDDAFAYLPCDGVYHRVSLDTGASTMTYTSGEYSNDVLVFRDAVVVMASHPPPHVQVYDKATGALTMQIPLQGYFNQRLGFSGGWLWSTSTASGLTNYMLFE